MKRKRNSSKVSIMKNMITGKKIDRIDKSFEVMLLRSFTDLEKIIREMIRSCRKNFFFLRQNLSVVGLSIGF